MERFRPASRKSRKVPPACLLFVSIASFTVCILMRTGSVARLFVPRYVRYLTQHRLPRLQGLHITKCPAIWCLSNWKGGVWGRGRGEEGKKRVPTRHWCVCTYFQTTAMTQGDAWTCLRSCQCHRRPGNNSRRGSDAARVSVDTNGRAGGSPRGNCASCSCGKGSRCTGVERIILKGRRQIYELLK